MKGIIKANQYQAVRQKGAILPLFAIGLIFIVGMGGLAIDSSHSFVNVTRLQNSLDAAALSAARTLNNSSGDKALAQAHGTATFNQHLGGEMKNTLSISFAYSEKLMPFAETANPSRYVRATVANHNIPVWFARVLPGVGATTTIGTTAVSGPIPIGTGTGRVCDIAPLVVCGDPTETTAGDDKIFGLPYGKGELYCLKASSPTGGTGGNGGGSNKPLPAECQQPVGELGPGNFQLIQLDCGPGGDCVRENLAGKYNGCLADASSVLTKPGNTVGPTAQGFNTRFGQYQGPVSAAQYPPDFYISAPLTYAQYTNKYKTGATVERTDGVANRRVMSVPIGDCTGAPGGQGTITVLGFGCYFMREPTIQNGQDNWIIGELIKQCEASGDIDYTPDVTDPSAVNFRIILYNDPGNLAS